MARRRYVKQPGDCGRKAGKEANIIGIAQSGTNRTMVVPVPGKEGEDGLDGNSPYISNGRWFINGVDLGPAQGYTPYIGDNGNWFINNQDTGVSAQPEELSPKSDIDIFE